ncbi:arginase [Thiobacillus sedimenti]|uniref:Arginase n=1 Tax=Thiobacillus sedimenti TaxID=3110231 RepID=A0ABZ1CJ10_9PROT|nr:arginase [Thiobacillus sp. SCUT-2]WRS39354.1 arginase [Thiobacillus sp. SCUT-2]
MNRAARNIVVIGAASGAGAPDPATAEGPDALRRYRVFHDTPLQHVEWDAILRVPREAEDTPLHAVAALGARLAAAVEQALRDGHFPLVVGGDHSCAIGTWSGVHRMLATRGPLGLMWIDAHMDSHTFATTESGQIHGMPLAALLGHGDAALTSIEGAEAKLLPEHVCLIGVRSFEAGEAALLHRLGVRVFGMDEVRERGLATVFAEALAIVRRGTAGFGVSIDLDALDPAEEPGVGTPVPGGLSRAELAAALAGLRNDAAFVAMEIVEYNPRRDRRHLTADAAGALLDAIAPPARRS